MDIEVNDVLVMMIMISWQLRRSHYYVAISGSVAGTVEILLSIQRDNSVAVGAFWRNEDETQFWHCFIHIWEQRITRYQSFESNMVEKPKIYKLFVSYLQNLTTEVFSKRKLENSRTLSEEIRNYFNINNGYQQLMWWFNFFDLENGLDGPLCHGIPVFRTRPQQINFPVLPIKIKKMMAIQKTRSC